MKILLAFHTIYIFIIAIIKLFVGFTVAIFATMFYMIGEFFEWLGEKMKRKALGKTNNKKREDL